MKWLKIKHQHYISEIDVFLREFNKDHALSNSQKAEKKKYNEIYRQRDNAPSRMLKPSENQQKIDT